MSTSIASIVIDCTDTLAVARFWSELLSTPLEAGADADWASLPSSPPIGFAGVPDKTPGKNSLHLDLTVSDMTAEVDRAISLGAKHVADHDGWTTLADPEGNLFDIAPA